MSVSRFLHLISASMLGLGLWLGASGAWAESESAPQDVVVVFDMSGSMWGQVDGVPKVQIARDAFAGLSGDWADQGVRAGLIAYGHRRKGDCSDIELLASPEDGSDLSKLIGALIPRGKTPLSDAVRLAAETLRFTEEKATVVLLSDGIETCNADPCALGAELESLGIDFTTHVVGFDIAEGERAELQCLAESTGGQYFDAGDADGLTEALAQVATVTAEPAPAPPEPAPPAEPATREVIVFAKPPKEYDHGPEATIFLDGEEIGRIAEGEHHNGLTVALPLGPISLSAESAIGAGSFEGEVTKTTSTLTIRLDVPETDFLLWSDGPFPTAAPEQTLLFKHDGVVDFYHYLYAYLYEADESDPDAWISESGALNSEPGQWLGFRIEPPGVAGPYELALKMHDGTVLKQWDVTFADDPTPQWLGPREVTPSKRFEARWIGDANWRTRFYLRKDGKEELLGTVDQMNYKGRGNMFKAPNRPGLYELVMTWTDADSERHSASLGPLAVGVELPDEMGGAADAAEQGGDGAAEAEAQAGSSGADMASPQQDADGMSGDWVLALQDGMVPIARVTLAPVAGADQIEAAPELVADPELGLGDSTGFERLMLSRAGAGFELVLLTASGIHQGSLSPNGTQWRGTLSLPGADGTPVELVRPDALKAAQDAFSGDAPRAAPEPEPQANSDPAPADPPQVKSASLFAIDERGEYIDGPVTWELYYPGADAPVTLTSKGSQLSQTEWPVGDQRAIARTADGRTGKRDFSLIGRATQFVTLKPEGEGDHLLMDVAYFCAPGEDCDMVSYSPLVDFTLPQGWGATMPDWSGRDGHWPRDLRLDFATVADEGVETISEQNHVYVTLNFPQRMAALGPCEQMVWGTFCHDHTDDPKLLAEIGIIRESLSLRPSVYMVDAAMIERLRDVMAD